MAAAVVQPLAALLDANAAAVTAAAAKGIIPGPATGPTGMGCSMSNAFSSFGGGSLFGGPGAAAPSPAPSTAPGAAVSVSQWFAHAHTDAASKALAHQHAKLHRFLEVSGYGLETRSYVRARISELARGHCLGEYKWDGGGHGWRDKLPTDAEVLVHLFKVSLRAGTTCRHLAMRSSRPLRSVTHGALPRVCRTRAHIVSERADTLCIARAARRRTSISWQLLRQPQPQPNPPRQLARFLVEVSAALSSGVRLYSVAPQ